MSGVGDAGIGVGGGTSSAAGVLAGNTSGTFVDEESSGAEAERVSICARFFSNCPFSLNSLRHFLRNRFFM